MSELGLAEESVRIAKDPLWRWSDFPGDDRYAVDDTELAIFDEQEVHLYGGGRIGRITHLRIHSRRTVDFDRVLRSSTDRFERLWDDALSASEYLNRMQHEDARSARCIDHTEHWRQQFDEGQRNDDAQLGQLELEQALRIIRVLTRGKKFQRYLDIGSCTGRILFGLRGAVEDDGVIVGVDIDPRCVKHLYRRNAALHTSDPRIKVLEYDFCGKRDLHEDKFDLVTCMLGTISYFGYPTVEESRSLRSAVTRLESLLAGNGIALVGMWSDKAISDKSFLPI